MSYIKNVKKHKYVKYKLFKFGTEYSECYVRKRPFLILYFRYKCLITNSMILSSKTVWIDDNNILIKE